MYLVYMTFVILLKKYISFIGIIIPIRVKVWGGRFVYSSFIERIVKVNYHYPSREPPLVCLYIVVASWPHVNCGI